jgi:hypothetical protein
MATPHPESRFKGLLLSPEEAAAVAGIRARMPVGVRSVGLALSAVFSLYRWIMQRRLKDVQGTTPALMEQALLLGLRESFIAFQPTLTSMTTPIMYAGYLVGVQESGVRLPQHVLAQMANGYAPSLGNYIHTVSSDALLAGFRALVNRKVDHRRALKLTTDAYGVDTRTMNTLVNVWTAEEAKGFTNVRQIVSVKEKRAATIIAQKVKERAHILGAHEAWNAKEQAKEASWLWAMENGIITGAARKMWVTADDERVCASCGPLDKVQIKVTDRFETTVGKTLTPPLHVGCRCEVTLSASMRRILLGQLRRKPVRKAYEGHPWARNQKRNEEGEWVKGPSSAHGQPQPALAPQPVYDPEPPEPPPSAPVEEEYIAFGPQYIAFAPQPAEPIQFGPPPQQASPAPATPHIEFQPRPEAIQFAPPPAQSIEFKPHTTPFSHATYTPSQATPQPVAPRPKERQRFEEEQWKPPKPSIITLDRGEEVYGVVPDDLDHVEDYELDQNRMVNDFADAHEMVENQLAENYTERIYDALEEEGKDLVPIYSEGGEQYYADYEGLRSLFEWTRAKQIYEDRKSSGMPEYMDPPVSFDPMQEIQVHSNYDNRAHQIEAEVLSRKGRLRGQAIDDVIEEITPSLVKVDRIDMEFSTEDLGLNRRDHPDWIVTGPHHNIEVLGSITDPETGQRILAHAYHLDPFDE